jgi:peroxiredoxin
MALELVSNLGRAAPDFALPGVDGKTYALGDVAGQHGTVVAFICNHCPYVKAVADRMVTAAEELKDLGFGFIAISSNDAASYPSDSFENMRLFSRQHRFSFPYVHDQTQATARAYGAACTPEFHGLDASGTVVYIGRLDEGRRDQPPLDAKRDLVEAMRLVAQTGRAPEVQTPAMGCSIKWKPD